MDSNQNIILTKFNSIGNKDITSEKSNDLHYSLIDESTESIDKEILPKCFRRILKKRPEYPIIRYKSNPQLDRFDVTLTINTYHHVIMNVSKSLMKIGLEPGKSVCILGFNHMAWFASQMGAIFCGAIATGIYTTNSAETTKFIINDCGCQVMIVENQMQLDKILSVIDECPSIRAVIQYDGCEPKFNSLKSVNVYSWTQFLQLSSNESEEVQDELETQVESRIEASNPDDCCLLIYTSGTTGNPKGVMLTHDNVLYASKMGIFQLKLKPFENSIISYLPLSHVAANVVDLISSFVVGYTVHFAQPDALKGSLSKTMNEVRPTVFLGVPRVFEKIQEVMQEFGANVSGFKRRIATWAKEVGYRNSVAKASGKKVDLSYCVASTLVFSKIKKQLGLDRCHYLASAAAPLAKDTLDYFMSLDMQIHQIYGMSECSGPQTIGTVDKIFPGCAGNLMCGTETRLVNVDENGVGEICMRGRHVFKGYFNNEEKTKETIDGDGWLHSGDLGKVEKDTFLFITGRIKELIITAGGENIAPVPIEDEIKALLPFISNIMLIGDKMKFISCLLTLKTKVDTDTQLPNDILIPAAVRALKELGMDATTVGDVIKEPINPALQKAIDSALKTVNQKSVSRAATVQKWKILEKDFSIAGGELGPTLKMKRPVIQSMYSEEIKTMYQ